ncbi:MOSC domain-containing protein [Qipengyuania vesicularis]|uniref:MOSC domain-containing protein n=1 Tax=Qipengyuania vesicularis TaxID=2867232 RepID=UPI001C86FDB9|nr:MOSC domain-containing protein [Qipengyuania vesicularis]MBX7526644.1 MOSC domain-containing protein [Qipengyuania vesicularis]
MHTVTAICIGLPKPFNGAELSAIDKKPVEGPVTIRSFGIEGDMVADTKHHGGVDMAVHQYPRDHYAGWDHWLGGHELLGGPAAFGENLMVSSLTEDAVHIGDRFRLGTALLEVSQARQPCWKIEHRFGHKGMVARIIEQHNCGWYYRVIEEGAASPGDTLEKVETGHGDWSVSRTFAKLYDPSSRASRQELEELASLDRLSGTWREKARKALNS